MALVLADRVKETTTTTGTGAVTLGGAATGYRAFSAVMANADTCQYCIAGASGEWEVGLGTYNTGNTLTRTTVYASSNAGSLVNFSAGTKDVFITLSMSGVLNPDNYVLSSGPAAAFFTEDRGNATKLWGFYALSGTYRVSYQDGTGASGDKMTIDASGNVVAAGSLKASATGVIFPDNTTQASAGAASVNVQEFTTPGTSTWTKPAGAKLVYVQIIGAGGGGGGGRQRSGTEASSGGAGGAGGVLVDSWFPAASLSATVSVVVGAGGTGGAGGSTSGGAGQGAFGGTQTSFGSTLLNSNRGGNGGGGSTSVNKAGTASITAYSTAAGNANGATSSLVNFGTAGNAGAVFAGGGASGSGFANASTTAGAGGVGGAGSAALRSGSPTGNGGTAGAAGGGAGGAGTSPANPIYGGDGGGGGGSSVTGVGGAGGAGGYPGGGGGGGGCSNSGFAGGAGGNGGNGYVRVTTFF